MINASQEFKELIKKGAKLVNYADITLKDGTVVNITPSDFALGGFTMIDETTDGKFGVGFAVGKTIELTIANHTNKFSNYDFYKSIIYIYIAIELEDGRVLKEKKGKYYVINPISPGDTINLSGVDSMYLFDKPYTRNDYPSTLQKILSDCCLDCGVSIGFGEFDNWNLVVNNMPEDATYRNVVSYVAQMTGYNARINNNDALELVRYNTKYMNINVLDGGNLYLYDQRDLYEGGNFTDYSLDVLYDGGEFTDEAPFNITKIKSLSVSTDDIVITGIVIENDDTIVTRGTEEYAIKIQDNPFTIGIENDIAQHLYNKLVGLRFRAMTCETTNNPLVEPYDECYVYDRKGNYYYSLINSVTYKINGITTVACKAEDPIKNDSVYTSDAAKAVVKARRETNKKISTYDQTVQNMNLLAANAMGLYRESETQSDNSVIYYQSNRPITKDQQGKCRFEIDSVVYKMTGNGFFVSEDGGISYTSGFDSNGNAVLNVLSAIGITFDWARGGILSLGGDNNVSGILHVKDETGKLLITLDKNGITFSGGQKIKYSDISEAPQNVTDFTNDAGFIDENTSSEIARNEITTAAIRCSQLKGGTVELGGSTTTPANLKLFNEHDELIGLWNVDGMYTKSKVVKYSQFSGMASFNYPPYNSDELRYLYRRFSNGDVIKIKSGIMRVYIIIPDSSDTELITQVEAFIGSSSFHRQTYLINRNTCESCWSELSTNMDEYYALEQNKNAYYIDIDMVNLMTEIQGTVYFWAINFIRTEGTAKIAGIRFFDRQYNNLTNESIIQYDDMFIENLSSPRAKQIQFDTFRNEINIGDIELKIDTIEMFPDAKIIGKKAIYFDAPLEGIAYFEDSMIIDAGKIIHKETYVNTSSTSGAKSLYVNEDGTFISSSSSKRYKENISYDVTDYNFEKLYDLNLATFKYKKECGVSNIELGLIAEDVAEKFPPCAIYNKDGTVESWSERIMIPALLKLIQNQNKRIEALEKILLGG